MLFAWQRSERDRPSLRLLRELTMRVKAMEFDCIDEMRRCLKSDATGLICNKYIAVKYFCCTCGKY